MDFANTVTILQKMKAKFEKDRPSWFENATDEEKAAFEVKNNEKIVALECALKCVKSFKQLQRAAEYIQDNIFADEGGGDNE